MNTTTNNSRYDDFEVILGIGRPSTVAACAALGAHCEAGDSRFGTTCRLQALVLLLSASNPKAYVEELVDPELSAFVEVYADYCWSMFGVRANAILEPGLGRAEK